MPIERLGPYTIGRRLRRGGMGTVYSGVEAETGAPVAVKVLVTGLAEQEGFRERFVVEIETLKKLDHPNIVRLLGFGEQDGSLFYSMELVDGTSLEDELRRGRRFDASEVLAIAIGACRALKHAHDRGVIHRDIKPANLIRSSRGQIKLADFGIAKLFGGSGMTGTRGVIGTVEYMAPEQADGLPLTPRCDLYSLGGVMYALLAGRPPFQSTSALKMLELQRNATPEPVRAYAPATPQELDDLILRLLAKDPEVRAANAQVLGRWLEAMEHSLAARERPAQDASVAQVDAPAQSPGQSGLAETVVPAVEIGGEQIAPRENRGSDVGSPEPDLPRTKVAPAIPAAAAKGPLPTASPDRSASPVASRKIDRFIAVDHKAKESLLIERDEKHPLVSIQTWLLIAALVGLAAIGWGMIQPTTADDLYERIGERAKGDIAGLREGEDDLREFLRRFPRDTRAATVRQRLDEIELDDLQRALERRADRPSQTDPLTPAELAYVDAIRLLRTDLDRGVLKLEALVALYDDENAPRPTQQCVELADKQLAWIAEEVARSAVGNRAVISQRLDAAKDLKPAAAALVYESVIELYAEKPWARPVVDEAREKLKKLGEGN